MYFVELDTIHIIQKRYFHSTELGCNYNVHVQGISFCDKGI